MVNGDDAMRSWIWIFGMVCLTDLPIAKSDNWCQFRGPNGNGHGSLAICLSGQDRSSDAAKKALADPDPYMQNSAFDSLQAIL